MKKAILKAITPYVCCGVVIGGSFFYVHLAEYILDIPSWLIGFFTATIAIFTTVCLMRMIWGE